jgi:hydrogenase expression/formation protein HypD
MFPGIPGKSSIPIVITGFEPIDMPEGVLTTARQLKASTAELENHYSRAVRREGPPHPET